MLTFGVIGDFGSKNKNSERVATLIKSWAPSYILTTGDNLYSPPLIKNYASVVGGLYSEFLPQTKENHCIRRKNKKETVLIHSASKKAYHSPTKFLPCVGNHDHPFAGYVTYFGLPTYYSAEFPHSPYPNLVKILSLNSCSDPDGDGRFNSHSESGQRSWLEKELNASSGYKWIIVLFHHPVLCSNSEDAENEYNLKRMFPFQEYANVRLVLCGHQHIYERLEVNGVTNVVVGTSGHSVRKKSGELRAESIVLDDSGFGALKLEISDKEIRASYHVLENSKTSKKSEKVDLIKDEFVIRH